MLAVHCTVDYTHFTFDPLITSLNFSVNYHLFLQLSKEKRKKAKTKQSLMEKNVKSEPRKKPEWKMTLARNRPTRNWKSSAILARLIKSSSVSCWDNKRLIYCLLMGRSIVNLWTFFSLPQSIQDYHQGITTHWTVTVAVSFSSSTISCIELGTILHTWVQQ